MSWLSALSRARPGAANVLDGRPIPGRHAQPLRITAPGLGGAPDVALIVPARDEVQNIGLCMPQSRQSCQRFVRISRPKGRSRPVGRRVLRSL